MISGTAVKVGFGVALTMAGCSSSNTPQAAAPTNAVLPDAEVVLVWAASEANEPEMATAAHQAAAQLSTTKGGATVLADPSTLPVNPSDQTFKVLVQKGDLHRRDLKPFVVYIPQSDSSSPAPTMVILAPTLKGAHVTRDAAFAQHVVSAKPRHPVQLTMTPEAVEAVRGHGEKLVGLP